MGARDSILWPVLLDIGRDIIWPRTHLVVVVVVELLRGILSHVQGEHLVEGVTKHPCLGTSPADCCETGKGHQGGQRHGEGGSC